jgi:hypothetical protein
LDHRRAGVFRRPEQRRRRPVLEEERLLWLRSGPELLRSRPDLCRPGPELLRSGGPDLCRSHGVCPGRRSELLRSRRRSQLLCPGRRSELLRSRPDLLRPVRSLLRQEEAQAGLAA